MLLAIDIGNSRIKAATFEEDKIILTSTFIEVFELKTFVSNLKIIDAAICSVVPKKTKAIHEIIKRVIGKSPFIISTKGFLTEDSQKDIRTNLAIKYKTPETLGVDRLCSAEGAFFLFMNSQEHKDYNKNTFILSIDFGTATTINVIEYPGKFVGGLIAPGLDMMFESLNKKTAQLPNINVPDFASVIGDSTNSSIASGVITSAVGMIEKMINNLKEEKSAKKIVTYLTGGNAKKIVPFLNFDFMYEEQLVLYGVNALHKLNNK